MPGDPHASTADTAAVVTAPQPTLDKRKSIILGVIGLAIIVFIFAKIFESVNFADVWSSLQSMGAVGFAIVIIAVVIYLGVYGLPFMAAAPGLAYWRSQQVNQAAFAISNGVPAGGAVGLAVQFGMLTSFGIGATAATAAITAVGIWSTFVSLGFPILGVVALSLSGGQNAYVGLGFLGLGILIAAVVLFVLIMRSERLAGAVGTLANRLIGPLRGRIHALSDLDVREPLLRFRASMYGLLKARWAAITGAQILVSLAQFLILYVALRGIQGWDSPGTSMLAAFAAFGISQIMLMVPITPGGVGTVDLLMITILTSLGADKADATAADVVWRAVSYLPQMILGIVALLAWYRRAGRTFAKAS